MPLKSEGLSQSPKTKASHREARGRAWLSQEAHTECVLQRVICRSFITAQSTMKSDIKIPDDVRCKFIRLCST